MNVGWFARKDIHAQFRTVYLLSLARRKPLAAGLVFEFGIPVHRSGRVNYMLCPSADFLARI